MGLSGISPLSLMLILAIIVVLFGTSRLKTIGTDLGEAIKNFRQAMNQEEEQKIIINTDSNNNSHTHLDDDPKK